MTAPVAHTAAGDVTTATDAANGSITCAKPANVASGDVLVAIVNSSVSGGTWDTIPAGWTQAVNYNSSRTTGVFTKPIPSAAGETATSYTWHNSVGSGRIGALIFRCTGVDGTTPIDATGAGTSTGSSSIAAPAVTAVSSEALLLAVYATFIASGTPNVITKPGSMTNVGGWNVTSGGTNSTTCLVCHETLTASGSTGTRTATVAPTGTGVVGLMLTLKPGSVAPPPSAPVAHTGVNDVSTAVAASSPTLRIPRPPATAVGDLLIGVLFHRNTGPAFTTKPPGWTPWPVSYTANGVLAAYWRHVTDAAGEPDHYTWRSPNGSARGAGMVIRVTGAAPPSATHGPVDSYGAATGSGTSSIVAPATTVVGPAALLLGCFASIANSTTPPVISEPSGMDEVAAVPIVTGSASAFLEVSAQALTSAGSSGTRTAAVAPAAGSVTGFLLAVAPPGYGTAQPPVVDARLTGGVTHNAAKAATVTRFAASVRFARSTSPAMTSPVYTAATAPDRDGIATASWTGLTAGTRYYWAAELDGALDGQASTYRTLPTPGAVASFSFCAGSCADTNSNATSFNDAAARTGPTGEPALFAAHLGDMHYQDIGIDDDAWALAAWLNAVGQPNQASLYKAAPLAYTWSDHDFGGGNVAADCPAAPAVQAVYRRLVPSHALPADGVGIYQSWQIGRVLVVMTDGRSYMSPITDPDGPGKTKLGADQLAWLLDKFTTPGIALCLWLHEDAWHNASTFGGDDTWSAYAHERDQIAAFVQANAVPLLYVHGDVHALSYDDGSHVPGRFPLVSVSPWDQTTFIGNGGLTGGVIPDPPSPSAKSQQYGWFDVLDDGAQVLVRYLGISAGHIAQRTDFSFGIKRRIGWGVPL